MSDEGLSLKEAASRLLLPPSTLDSWLKAARNGKLGEIGKAQRPLTEIELELARTKRELAEFKMERDLLKKNYAVLCWETYSRNASSMRVCQPAPVARK